MFYRWAPLPDSRASGPASREWNFLGWGWGLGSITLSSSNSSHAAKSEQVLGVRVTPSTASSECLKSAKQHKPWPQQTCEAAWASPEQLALQPGLHGHLSSGGRASDAGHAQWGPIAEILGQWLYVGVRYEFYLTEQGLNILRKVVGLAYSVHSTVAPEGTHLGKPGTIIVPGVIAD